MLKADVIKKLDGLSLRMRSAARGGAGGSRRSKALGSSSEFSDFREYVPGDDIRRIDWNAYGRFEKLFLKLFMEEQEAVNSILLDTSRSMEAKWQGACFLAEALAYLSIQGGDRVRLILLKEDKALASPIFSGRAGFEGFSAFLSDICPSGETRLCHTLRRLDVPFQRGMSILISDFFSKDGYQEALKYLLYKKQELNVLQILSAGELRPELEGPIRLVDSESREKLELLIGPGELEAYRKALGSFQKEIFTFCHSLGIAAASVEAETVEESFLYDLKKMMLIT